MTKNKALIEMTLKGIKFNFVHPPHVHERAIAILNLSGQEYPIPVIDNYNPEIIVDIGSHIGSSIMYFLHRFPNAKIYGYEPNTINFEYLKENTKRFDNIIISNYGLYDENKETQLFIGEYNTGQSSIFQSRTANKPFINIKLKDIKEELEEKGIQKISILKIDTEGCEIAILERIKDIVLLSEMICLEYHSEEDRIKIDKMLSDKFILCGSKSDQIHLGTVIYLSKQLVKEKGNIGSPYK